MNKKTIFYTLGNILKIEALFLLLPLITSFIYNDGKHFSFIFPIVGLLIIGYLLTLFIKNEKLEVSSKDSFVIVGLAWVILSLTGVIPYILSGSITSFVDALFETVSGYTTTGATIFQNGEIEELPKSILLYRSMTHFIGGMGVLMLILAIMPSNNGKSIFLMKAESTGPQVSRLTSKTRSSALTLYIIYVVLTILEIILLACSKDINFFTAINYSFSTAGTGGFGIFSDSCASLGTYGETVIGIFMILFGVNFTVIYLVIIGKTFKALKNEELITYLSIVGISILLIGTELLIREKGNFFTAFFTASSFMTSTGFSITDAYNFPLFSKAVLLLLMFIGACAGSTGGGLKVARFCILFKSAKSEMQRIIHPRSVKQVKYDNEVLDEETQRGTLTYLLLMIFVLCIGIFILSLDSDPNKILDFESNFSVAASCLNNCGLAFGNVFINGTGFAYYNDLSKITLSIMMLIGRLELYPILLLLNIKMWRNK